MKRKQKTKPIKKLKKVINGFLKIDKILLLIVAVWAFAGFFVFSSAALGTLASGNIKLSQILLKQLFFLIVSVFAMFFVANIKFKNILNLSPWIYGASLVLLALVFVPGLGMSSGGATRWLLLGPFSIQPGEFLKFSVPIFALYIFLKKKKEMSEFKSLIYPAMALFVPVALLLAMPDTSTSAIIIFAVASIYFLFGAPFKNILVSAVAFVLLLVLLVSFRPYIKERMLVYMGLKDDPQGASYQIEQAKYAIGSGGIFGKGYGQGVQKFGYLPEPAGDSVFATFAEEFGFFGVTLLLVLITLFVLRSFNLAKKSRSLAASASILSMSLLVFFQSFVNISAMSGVLPLTGLTLPLFSLGGTSLLTTMIIFGIIFSAARDRARS